MQQITERFMVMRLNDKYVGEFFKTREEAEEYALEGSNGDPGGGFLILEVVGFTTRPIHPRAILTRLDVNQQ